MLLTSCGQESAPPPPPVRKAAVKPVEAAPGVDKTAGVQPTAAAVKLRNPFLSYIIVRRETEGVDIKAVKGPLQCCDISVFRIQAVKTGGAKPKAVVLAPDGKRYMVGIGDAIGMMDGKIIKIDENGMMVKEFTKDPDGKVILTNDVAIKLHPDVSKPK
ncbi:MAG: pilus assembly protein PilP [Deltaproteobacteria bacterium]|nr:pilus assembly protein PilP [Deltaproteobacteria bacterium]